MGDFRRSFYIKPAVGSLWRDSTAILTKPCVSFNAEAPTSTACSWILPKKASWNRDHWPKGTSGHNIEKVATDKTRRRKFQRILEGLDEEGAVEEQATYLLRAFSGLQLFPDANHRTGLVFVGFYLDLKGYEVQCALEDVVALVEDIRPERGPFSARRTVDRLGERDASFTRVLSFMQAFVRRKAWWRRILPSRAAARIKRITGRLPLHGMHVPEDPVSEMRRKED